MNVNKLKYLLALLFVSFSTLASMAQEYEKQEIKILDFKQVSNFHIDYAKEFAYQESNRDSTIWALLIVETNDPNIRVISSESNPGHYVWEELRKNPRFDINEHRMPGEIWYSLRPGAKQFRVAHSLYRHDTDIPAIYNREGKHIGRLISNWYIPPAKMLGEFGLVEAGKTYRLKIEVPQYNPGPVEEKKQEMGWVVIDSDPQGAKVFSVKDGVETLMDMPTPYTVKVPYGTYFYRISKSLYHDENIEVVVNQAKVPTMVKLRPDFGSINITSTPAGAEVSLSYPLSQTYTTPCRIDNIPSGTYTLTLMKAAHTPYEQTVTVTGGEVTQVNAALDSRLAHVTINSLPGATITINGENKGTTSFSGDLVANTYDIEATLAGHEKATKQITVVAKQPQTIELNPTPMYGTLDIMSTPYNATVSVDGKVAGTTPLTLDKLLVGTHTVKITLDGYEEVTKTVTVAKDSEETLNLQLTKIVAPSVVSPVSLGYNQVTTTSGLSPRWSSSATAEQRRIIGELIESMVMVEGGTFAMGAQKKNRNEANYDSEIWDDESPTHRVTLSDYYIGAYEVTQEQWQAVMGNNPSYYKGSRKPVETVSWNDCREFIKKLNSLTGLNFKLPTEAQWEYAARGGNKSRGYKYSGSNSIGSVAYFNQSSGGPTTVGSKQANELGLYDMSGNVWEWCQDWIGDYSSSSQTDPTGPSTGSYRVRRGGSWFSDARSCRVSLRHSNTPDSSHDILGLRLAINIDENSDVNHDEVVSIPGGLTPRWSSSATAEQRRIIGELIESMVMVEGGTFTMGAISEQGSDAYDREKPTHRVTLSDYYIGKYEVTQEQWQAVMGNNPSEHKGNRKPVERVSWNDCQKFIKKLNSLTGLNFKLPTEAQWEYAARGGNKSRGYKYSGISDNLSSVAWYRDNSSDGTKEVGQKQSNELGLYDMSGNVSEWCQDWYGSYSSSSQTDPTGPSTGSDRVLRGGSWDDNAWFCRVSNRSYGLTPDYSHYFLGLRLAINIDENSDVKHDEDVSISTTLTPNWSSSATAEQRRIIGELIESMVMVEGGTFTMGATSEQGSETYGDENPTHRVTLSDYYIGKYEVTQEQWQAVMGKNPSNFKGSRKPVECVSWNECQEFIKKLNSLTGLNFKLPTEAQWEYAARGGNKSQGYKYSGSNNIESVAWYWNNASKETHPVGQKQPNELGLYDISGNVWEWCQDWKGDYSSSSQTNPTGPSTGSHRVLRGGSWFDLAGRCRVSSRGNRTPDGSGYNLGLRLVVSQF